ncbi:hypothetical protein BDR07DRAFT_1435400 [Suillus spraguei]|nr:hypothetical protein BDR07DRAFT_1435400 [Suillus spraguei]
MVQGLCRRRKHAPTLRVIDGLLRDEGGVQSRCAWSSRQIHVGGGERHCWGCRKPVSMARTGGRRLWWWWIRAKGVREKTHLGGVQSRCTWSNRQIHVRWW